MITILTTSLFALSCAVSLVSIAVTLRRHGRQALDLRAALDACDVIQEVCCSIREIDCSAKRAGTVLRPDFSRASRHPAPHLRAAA